MTAPPSGQPEPALLSLVVVAAGDAGTDLRRLVDSMSSAPTPVPLWIVDHDCDHATRTLIDEIASGSTHVHHLRPSRNLGYGAAVNHALGALRPPLPTWVLVCNADLVFPPGSLDTIRGLLEAEHGDSRVGCVAPQLHDFEPEREDGVGEVQPSVGRFPGLCSLLLGRLRDRRHRKYVRHAPETRTEIEWATGACLAVRTAALGEIGGFDEGFFLDYEDTDLCQRLRENAWSCVFDPSWRVVHVHPDASGPPSPARHVHTRRSLVRYLMKHRPRWEAAVMVSMYRMALWWYGYAHPFAQGWRAGLDEYAGRGISDS